MLLKNTAICTAGELFGGVERHILGVMCGLRERHVETLLVLFHDRELAAQARDQGFEPIVLPRQDRFFRATSRALVDILRRRHIRVVHIHGYKATVHCAIARAMYPFVLVKTEHGLPEPMAGAPLRLLRDRFYHFLETKATRLANVTVCYVTTELSAFHARDHAGLHTTVIPNAVAAMDRSRFERPPELREDRFNLGIVGRLESVKGHHVAIEAMADSGMPPDVHLQIVGAGPREAALRALAERRGVSARVHFLGFQRNVYQYVAHCDVLLLPSLHEGLPYTLLEGMALGTPVIASRVGGLAEVLQDNATGLLIPPGDAAALARAVLQLRADPALGDRLGERARQLQREKYSLDAMTKSYLEVYEEALRRSA